MMMWIFQVEENSDLQTTSSKFDVLPLARLTRRKTRFSSSSIEFTLHLSLGHNHERRRRTSIQVITALSCFSHLHSLTLPRSSSISNSLNVINQHRRISEIKLELQGLMRQKVRFPFEQQTRSCRSCRKNTTPKNSFKILNSCRKKSSRSVA